MTQKSKLTIFKVFQEFVVFGPKHGPLTHCVGLSMFKSKYILRKIPSQHILQLFLPQFTFMYVKSKLSAKIFSNKIKKRKYETEMKTSTNGMSHRTVCKNTKNNPILISFNFAPFYAFTSWLESWHKCKNHINWR